MNSLLIGLPVDDPHPKTILFIVPTPPLQGKASFDCKVQGAERKRTFPKRKYLNKMENQLIKITFDWVKTPIGILIISELIVTFLCACCASSLSTWVGSGCAGKIGFLDFVAWTAFLNILINMIIRILGLWERLLWVFRHPAVHLVLCCLAVVGFLIASSLVASCQGHVYNGGTAVAAAVFGFIAIFLFAIEAYLDFKRYRNMESEGRKQTEEDVKADVI